MSHYIVGLTGGIGSGKSAAADMFKELGINVIDADQVARDVVAPSSPALTEIHQRFGDTVLLETGELNRAFLREKVFSNAEDKQWLNQLLHPLIRIRLIEQCNEARSSYCILMVPLLIENNMQSMVNRIAVVDVSESQQLARASVRDDTSVQQIQAIMAAQASRKQRLQHADDVIDNRGDLQHLRHQVVELHQQYCQYALASAAKHSERSQ